MQRKYKEWMSKRSCESCQDEDNTGIDASLLSSRHTQSLCILYSVCIPTAMSQTKLRQCIQNIGFYSTILPFNH